MQKDRSADFRRNHLSVGHNIVEGTSLFQEYKDCSLREIERSLFFAASHYRRSLDLMISSSSPWAHTTLYYGSWYASHALLGMFGCTVFDGKFIIDVNRSLPGRQELQLRRVGNGSRVGQEITTYSGSHRVFWDLYYNSVQNLIPVVDTTFAAILSPIMGDPVWQIENRNDVNYDTSTGLDLAGNFDLSFSQTNFPNCLSGRLATQYQILETLLELVFSLATDYGLHTDALDSLNQPEPLRDKVSHLIFSQKPPALVRKSKKSLIT